MSKLALRGVVGVVAWIVPALALAQTLQLTGSSNTSDAFAHTDEGLLCDAERTTDGPTTISSGSSSFRVRLRQFIASDCAQVSGPEPMTGNASYNLSFTAQCPVGYRLTINTQRRGALIANQEEGENSGSADLSGVTGSTSHTLTSGSIQLADLPGQSSGSDKCLEFDQTSSATIVNVSNGSAVAHSLGFSWSGNTDSQGGAFNSGDEGCVIMGLTAGGDFPGLDCDNYPNLEGGCAGGRNAANDGHFTEVSLTCLCGDGVNDGSAAGEQCDEGAANGTAASCCTSDCKLKSAGTQCRATTGECDPAEQCTGSSGACPANAFTAAGTACTDSAPSDCFDAQCNGSGSCSQTQGLETNAYVCRGAASLCDQAESCSGSSGTCPADGFLPNGTTCRAAANECDVAETCTGGNIFCPADAFQPSGTTCTDSNTGDCFDAQCNGSGTCNQNQAFESAAYTCRAALGVCDEAESCSGSSGSCPADERVDAGTTCRGAVGECDVAETCDGTSVTCPADALVPAGTSCTDLSPGDCHDAQCNGSGTCNQTLDFEDAGYTCRASVGDCDAAETCSGSSGSCPSDGFAAAGTSCTDASPTDCFDAQCDGGGACNQTQGVESAAYTCRPTAGVCDVAETCDGSSTSCPADQFLDDATVCRVAANECDAVEHCSGSAATCPSDGFQTAGTTCTDSNEGDCFRAVCNGGGGCDQAGALEPSSHVCRASTGECDPQEVCTGETGVCPNDAFVAASTPCTDNNTNDCFDAQCNGTGACSQTFALEGTSHVCRAAVDVCDAAESCSGVVGTCPADGFQSSATVCRPAVDAQCDVAENCSGLSTSCPADSHVGDATACDDSNGCTTLDSCQGGTCTGGSPRSCSDGIVCTQDLCVSTGPATFTCDNTQVTNGSCYIDGSCVADGVDHGANECQECDSGTSQTEWSNKAENATCSLGFGVCDGEGACDEPTPVCPDTPMDGCLAGAAERGKLVLRDKPPAKDGLDSMVWKLAATAADFNDFGDPRHSTSYALCLYDSRASGVGEPPNLIRSFQVPEADFCTAAGPAGATCWKSIVNRKYLFRDQRKPAPNDGVRKMVLTSSSKPGKATILVQAKGEELDPPPLPLEGDVVMQLISSRTANGGACWEARFSEPYFKADGSAFVDVND